MRLMKKIMAAAIALTTICGASIASSSRTAIDLNSEEVLLDKAKPKDARAVLFIELVPSTLEGEISFDPDLVDSLYDQPNHHRFTNNQVKNAVTGLSHLYRRLSDIAGNPSILKARLQTFINTGSPLRAKFTLDFTHPTLDLENKVNADAYQQLSTTLRYEEYGTGEGRDLSREQAARRAVFEENKAKNAIGGTGAVDAVKSTAVSVPSPVVAIPNLADCFA